MQEYQNHPIAECYPPGQMKEFHPIAKLFPLLDERSPEFVGMVDSIKSEEVGLLEPITLLEDMILDGRNRARACAAAGIEPKYEEYIGSDPVAFVAARNLHRRNLSDVQRAFIAEEMAKFSHGGDRGSNQYSKWQDLKRGLGSKVGIAKAARIMRVPKISVDRIRKIKRQAAPEVVQAVREGKLRLYAADQLSNLPKEEQVAALTERTSKSLRPKRANAPERKPASQSGRLTPGEIFKHECKINTPSIYPEDLPLPVHPTPGLNGHIQEAFIDLKSKESLISKMSRRQLYDEVWVYTQRIQTFAPGYGKPGYIIENIDPRWIQWAKSVAGKVRAREFILLNKSQASREDARSEKPRKFSDAGFEKQLKQWQRLLKRGLGEIAFAPDEETRVLEATEQILFNHFEGRRASNARRAPSPTEEPHKINGSSIAQ